MNMTRRTAAVRVLAVLVLAAWGLCGRVVADEAHVAEIVAAVQEGVAVAGFGNSYSTYGNFLRYIVTQHLPGGARGFALMINGGRERPGFEGLFKLVNQSEVVGARNR